MTMARQLGPCLSDQLVKQKWARENDILLLAVTLMLSGSSLCTDGKEKPGEQREKVVIRLTVNLYFSL